MSINDGVATGQRDGYRGRYLPHQVGLVSGRSYFDAEIYGAHASFLLQLHPRHLTSTLLRVPDNAPEKIRAKISARGKNFVLLCRTVDFEILIHPWQPRTIQKAHSAVHLEFHQQVGKQHFLDRRPLPAAGTPRRVFHNLCQPPHYPPIRGCAFWMRWKKRSTGTPTTPG